MMEMSFQEGWLTDSIGLELHFLFRLSIFLRSDRIHIRKYWDTQLCKLMLILYAISSNICFYLRKLCC